MGWVVDLIRACFFGGGFWIVGALMLLVNVAIVGVLGLVLVPVVLHLWNKRRRKVVDWGAMRFLEESVVSRRREVRLEDILLMVLRCLLVGLVALVVLRPFVPDGGTFAWGVVLPVGLLGIAGLGVMAALWGEWGKVCGVFGLTCVLLFGAWWFLTREAAAQADRLGAEGRQDVVFLVDVSGSMGLEQDGATQLRRALGGVREVVEGLDSEDRVGVVLGGGVPGVLSEGLVVPGAVEGVIESVRDTGGTMDGVRGVEAALELLDEGSGVGRKVVVVTDRQRLGWALDSPGVWEGLARRAGAGGVVPQLVLWDVPFPEGYRNAAVTAVDFPDGLPEAGEPVRVRAVVANTGRVAITPREVSVEVEGRVYAGLGVDQIVPGALREVDFEVVFPNAGAVAFEVRMVVDDDLRADNRYEHVVHVGGGLRVLVVEAGEGANADYFARAGAYVRLALAEERAGLGMEMEVVEPGALEAPGMLAGYGVVVLADVPVLSALQAEAVARFVESGGGLLVAPGEGARVGFYNGWVREGRGVLPMVMGERRMGFSRAGDRVGVERGSLLAGVLAGLADEGRSDLMYAYFSRYWMLRERVEGEARGVRVEARSSRGAHPLVVSGEFGAGRVVQLAFALDGEDSSLVKRETFVPVVHELLKSVAGRAVVDLNVVGAGEVELFLGRMGAEGVESAIEATVTGPEGVQVPARLRSGGAGMVAAFLWGGVPGLYQLNVPEGWEERTRGLHRGTGEVPFTVRSVDREGYAELLTESDVEVMRSAFDVVEAGSAAEVGRLMSGEAVGRELWRYVAFGALGFLVLEALVGRWVGGRRKVERERVVFEVRDRVSGSTMEKFKI